MKEIDVKMSTDDLLVVIGSLIKLQVSNGVKDEQVSNLLARLSLQAIEDEDILNQIASHRK